MGYFVDEPPTVAHGGRGVVVGGCPALPQTPLYDWAVYGSHRAGCAPRRNPTGRGRWLIVRKSTKIRTELFCGYNRGQRCLSPLEQSLAHMRL